MSYPSSPLSPYLGALELQFAPSPFYIFLELSLKVLYELESLHLDDYNLIYSQNKNRGLDKILIAFLLKTQHFPFLQTLLQTNPNQSKQCKTISNLTKTIQEHFYTTFGVLLNPNTSRKGVRVWFFLP